MRGGAIVATNITKEHGTTVVLDRLSLTVPPGSRIGVWGRRERQVDAAAHSLGRRGAHGRPRRAIRHGAYLPQEPERRARETLLGFLARRTGVAGAEIRMDAGGDDYHDALERFLASAARTELGARKVCARLGIDVPLDAEVPTLSGGDTARVSLAALLLSRLDVLCLDEPTNDLDFDGLERLEAFVQG